jgi:CrcB protein
VKILFYPLPVVPMMRIQPGLGNADLLKAELASDLFDGLCFRQAISPAAGGLLTRIRVQLLWRLVQYRIFNQIRMSIYIAIAVGGSLGAVSRYWVSSSTYQWLGQGFPYGTLAVNLLGSLLMGFLSVLLVHRFHVSDEIRIGLLAGFLGSFTTFSTFAMDTLHLAGNEAMLKAVVYIMLSVLLCIIGAWAGLVAAKQMI